MHGGFSTHILVAINSRRLLIIKLIYTKCLTRSMDDLEKLDVEKV